MPRKKRTAAPAPGMAEDVSLPPSTSPEWHETTSPLYEPPVDLPREKPYDSSSPKWTGDDPPAVAERAIHTTALPADDPVNRFAPVHALRHRPAPEKDPPLLRTDLACEATDMPPFDEEETVPVGSTPVTVSRAHSDTHKKSHYGRCTTLALGPITAREESELPALSDLIAAELRTLAALMLGKEITPALRVLVVGLGNADMTPDAVGPGTVRRLTVTRHLKGYDESLFASLNCCELSAFIPGVMGQTGLESVELVKAAARLTRPDLVVAVDALAARSVARLSSTIQLSDKGIAPGSGIGNHRLAIDSQAVGCPVLSLGVPTVVDSSTLVLDALCRAGLTYDALPEDRMDALHEVLSSGRSFIVSPKDSDRMVEMLCRALAGALDRAFGVGVL